MGGITLPALSAPERLADHHDVSAFRCGNPDLDGWLIRQAWASEGRSARTYVVAVEHQIIGYYCLAAASVARHALPTARLRRNQPEHVPVIVLGRLAVEISVAGRGVGSGLVKDAMRRALAVAEMIGIRAMLVHAITDRAAAFYRRLGFLPSPTGERTLFLPLETIVEALSS